MSAVSDDGAAALWRWRLILSARLKQSWRALVDPADGWPGTPTRRW